METAAKVLLGLALVLALTGAGLLLASKLGLERLPGDVVVKKGNFTLYAPIGLMIVLSLIATVILNLISRS
jgi:Protein of unknown function (DUF2905)